MKKYFLIFFIVLGFTQIFAQPKFSGLNAAPGAFSRMGFNPRGIAMGNSISALNDGNLNSYYNPALSVFQVDNSFTSSFGFLSLDRKLNFINFTRRFELYSDRDTAINRKPRSTAGISLGIINSGVNKIDARDRHGFKDDELSTSENLFFVGLGVKFSEKISAGLNVKLYYYKLYEDVTSTGIGFDLGVLYTFNPQITFSFVMADLNSKYKWDTSPIYSTDGITSVNLFPTTKKIGTAVRFPDIDLVTTAEFVFDSYASRILKIGAEYNLIENLFLRGGIDNWFLNNKDNSVRPSFGLSYTQKISSLYVGFEYAFVLEKYSPSDRHFIGLNINF